MKFKRGTLASLAPACTPIGYSVRVLCICGVEFVTPGMSFCPNCGIGIAIRSPGGMVFQPVAVAPPGVNLAGLNPPRIVGYERESE